MRSLGFSLVAIAALAAACAPSTFDGLTGGADATKPIGPLHEGDTTSPDKSLAGKDPRPISPLSTSWVNTDKPRFTWALQDGTTGATVELSRTRDFAKVERRLTATGTEATISDRDGKLELGTWFWRLQARNTNPGVTYSPVWSVLVRGKSKNATKENTASHGTITDLNGDGLPEILTAMTTKEPLEDGKSVTLPSVIPLFGVGAIGHFDPFNPAQYFPADAGGDAPAFASSDMNGDGYGDIVVADFYPAAPPYYPVPGGELYVGWGGEKGYGSGPKDGNGDGQIELQDFNKTPALTVGDFNGDGFGDISMILPDLAMTAHGSALGWFDFLPFEAASSGATPASGTPSSLITNGDFDGDGKSDLAYTPYDSVTPLRLAQGSSDRYAIGPNMTVGADLPLPTRATSLATGDFDGDGFDEVAFATTVGGKAAVCVTSFGNSTLSAHACWISTEPVAGFGTTLGAGDVDADGVDEIFVGSTSGITVLTHAGLGYADDTSTFTPTLIKGDYTSHFSVFYPGRPGKAQWAAYGKDGHTLYVVEGLGESGAAQQYDFTKMKEVKDLYAEFVHFGTSIR